MRHEIVETSNVRKFLYALQMLQTRTPGLEGMGILWGRPGEGKSTVVAYAATQYNGIFLRATSAWTMSSMLQALMRELDLPPMRRRADMIEHIAESLSVDPRPVFIDEADYLIRGRGEMLDVVRDIYDLTGVPVVLIGMEQFAHQLTVFGSGRFRRRITQWVEFAGLTLDDTALVCERLSEVEISPDLVEHVHKKCEANIGRIVIAISRIEAFARTNGLDRVSLEQYGRRRPLYLTENQLRGAA